MKRNNYTCLFVEQPKIAQPRPLQMSAKYGSVAVTPNNHKPVHSNVMHSLIIEFELLWSLMAAPVPMAVLCTVWTAPVLWRTGPAILHVTVSQPHYNNTSTQQLASPCMLAHLNIFSSCAISPVFSASNKGLRNRQQITEMNVIIVTQCWRHDHSRQQTCCSRNQASIEMVTTRRLHACRY